MMSRRTIKTVAIVLAVLVALTALAGWDSVFGQYVTADWIRHSGLDVF